LNLTQRQRSSKVLFYFQSATLENVTFSGRFSRRSLLALPAAAACSRRDSGFQGYAFIANQEGGAVAVVDLEALAVVRHIAIDGAPAQVLAAADRPAVYVLVPEAGAIHEIQVDQLRVSRKVSIGAAGVSLHSSPQGNALLALVRDPRALVSVDLNQFRVNWRLRLPEIPVDAAVLGDGKTAAISSAEDLRLVDLDSRKLSAPLGTGNFGPVRFLRNGKTLIAANRGQRAISLYDVASRRLLTHLPVSLEPEYLCFNSDGGQLFATGAGLDAVVIVYPYQTEIAETVLAGRAPGPMAASESLLFVASPASGDVSILNIPSRKVIAVVQVGTDPGYIAVTPDDRYALVLNRKSGDVAVLRVATITPNRYKSAAVLTMIPVGSRPVSAAMKAV
jgi:YVTN family beta-propeller protein